MEQPASFGLTSELHVGITPQIGSARLCGLQLMQGTLAELKQHRSERSIKKEKTREVQPCPAVPARTQPCPAAA